LKFDRLESGSLQNAVQVGSLSNVHFRYPGAATEALKGISFETKPKELIAILGMTGSRVQL